MNNDVKNKVGFSVGKIILALIIVAILFVSFIFFYNRFYKSNIETTVSSILNDEKVISQLSSLEVPYAGIYQEYDENNRLLRSIAYKGLVDYGIDISEIEVISSSENKLITLNIPNISLLNIYVEPDSMRSIPEGSIDDLQNRLQSCKEDLEKKFKDDKETKDLAISSTIDTLKNFFLPIINSIDSEYQLIIKLKQ